jgi:prephenate dehydrogenase
LKKTFNHIAIVGLGLIGGSLARAIKKKNLAGKIIGYGRSCKRMEKAYALGLVDEYFVGFEKGFEDVDLVIICTPVRSIAPIVHEVLPFIKPGTIITDVGSVKGPIIKEIEPLKPKDIFFIGGHPIAGTENSGFESSLVDLFENRIYVLTPTDCSNREALTRLEHFWKMIGSHVICMDVQTHDMIFAAISHLPHMVAFSLVNAIVDMEGFENMILQYSAGGFKDFTRIAASDPVMWRDIALMNKDNILRALEFFEGSLSSLKNAIQREDQKNLQKLFQKSRDTRRGI